MIAVSCPYSGNAFCRSLEPGLLQRLCGGCRIKKYAAGQRLSMHYWDGYLAVLLDGLTIAGEPDPSGNSKLITCGIASGGTIIAAGHLNNVHLPSEVPFEVLCLIDCAVAVFNGALIMELLNSNIPFMKTVFQQKMHFCGMETNRFLRETAGKDAYAAVRFVLQYCAEHNLPPLTHQQIALICNRRRPTVTEVMYKLIQNEPELFQNVKSAE